MPSKAGVTIKGNGNFKQNGFVWTSHQAAAVFVLKRNRDGEDEAIMVRAFGQLPRSNTQGEYVRPFFRKPEFQRMKERALQVLLERREGNMPQDRPREVSKSEIKPHEVELCERCSELRFPCTGIVEALGNFFHIPLREMKKRQTRVRDLDEVLYFLATAKQAKSIVRNQSIPIKDGPCGRGLYFSERSVGSGVVLKCKVRLGKCKTIQSPTKYTFATLLEDEYDSVCFTDTDGQKRYVVFNVDQFLDVDYLRNDEY